MRKTLVIIMSFGFLICMAMCAHPQDNKNQDQGSIYNYDEKNPPVVFFFPPEKARWDGNKVTMKEWYTLTDLQKEKFVNEYFGELERQYRESLEGIGLDYLNALNVFSYYSNDRSMNQPSTKFIKEMLVAQGKLPDEKIRKKR